MVFDDASGQTHQLDTLTARTLLAIEEAPRSIEVLMTDLATDLPLTIGTLESTLPAIIEQLRSVGLIDIIAE